jgi:hypothetical protein
MEEETGILGGGAQMKITASQETERDKEDNQEQNRKEKEDPTAKRFMTERNKNPRHYHSSLPPLFTFRSNQFISLI